MTFPPYKSFEILLKVPFGGNFVNIQKRNNHITYLITHKFLQYSVAFPISDKNITSVDRARKPTFDRKFTSRRNVAYVMTCQDQLIQ